MSLNLTSIKAIYLANHSLNNCINNNTTEIIDNNLSDLFEYCILQKLDGIICPCIDKADISLDEKHKWIKRKSFYLYRNLKFDNERQKLFNKLTENKIYFMPMKGIILKDLYPEPGMRPMGDNDIYFDPKKTNEVDKIMKDLGFSGVVSGSSFHNIYTKESFLIFEMHIALMKSGFDFSKKRLSAIRKYYMAIEKRLIPDKDNPYLLNFTNEDFYIFHLVHALSHFNSSGFGIRFLTDTYLMLEKYKESLNWNYINSVLSDFQMIEFEYMLRSLSQKLFSKFEDSFEKFKEYIESSFNDKELSALLFFTYPNAEGNFNTAMDIQMSLIHQKKNDFYELNNIEHDFSVNTKVKYLMYYLYQLSDEIEINLILRNKSIILTPFILLAKLINKIARHGDSLKKYLFK